MVSPLRIAALDHTDQNTLDRLIGQLNAKGPRNRTRASYYDGTNQLLDLGISIPPNMRRVSMVLGWPAKAVDVLSRRCNLDGFVIPGGSAEDMGINEMCEQNNIDVEAPQAHTSAFIHSCAFITTTLGDVASGEPPVLITARSALTGTGLWDRRRRCISAFLSVTDADDNGEPTGLVMYLPDRVLTLNKLKPGIWRVESVDHNLGRVPVEPLVYQPRLDRPFGSARISRAVMSLTDAAMRTALRSEVSAEFYSSPQRYLLGADESVFVDEAGNRKGTWETVLGRMLAIGPDDETGDLPTLGQFPQASMEPHKVHLEMWAMLFAGETNLPVSSLGVVQDNPASAEAIYAAKEELVTEAEGANDAFGVAWVRAIRTGVQLREKLGVLPPEFLRLRAKWRNPATPSKASAADAVVKMVSAGLLPADSEVTLEAAGFDTTTIARLVEDRRRTGAVAALNALTAAATAARGTEPPAPPVRAPEGPPEAV